MGLRTNTAFLSGFPWEGLMCSSRKWLHPLLCSRSAPLVLLSPVTTQPYDSWQCCPKTQERGPMDAPLRIEIIAYYKHENKEIWERRHGPFCHSWPNTQSWHNKTHNQNHLFLWHTPVRPPDLQVSCSVSLKWRAAVSGCCGSLGVVPLPALQMETTPESREDLNG